MRAEVVAGWMSLAVGLACTVTPASGPSETVSGTEASDAGDSSEDASDDSPFVCLPGEQRCAEGGGLEVCEDSGLGWMEVACDTYETCKPCLGDDDPLCEGLDARCAGPCDTGQANASSLGCSFVTVWMPRDLEITQVPQVVQVTNPDSERVATVTLLEIPAGEREEYAVGEPVLLEPGETHRFELPHLELLSTTSLLRTGALWRIASDLPVAAHQFAPYDFDALNFGGSGGGTLLLPEDAFRGDFIATSRNHKPGPASSESYFTVIALQDETTIGWRPPQPTVGNGLPIPPAAAGERVELTLNRYDWARVHVAEAAPPVLLADVSGTVIDADAPVVAYSAVPCANMPASGSFGTECDHMQEQLIPIDFWGQHYVVPSPPKREGDDFFELRIYASGAGQVSEDGGAGLGPWIFTERGQWEAVTVHPDQLGEAGVVLSGDVAFMPVLYPRSQALMGQTSVLPYGDPAMVQMLPTAQFLDRVALSTPESFLYNYVQVVRPLGGAAVLLDGEAIGDWSTLGDYEVATVQLPPDVAALLSSDEPFGSLRYGYNGTPDDTLQGAAYAGLAGLGFAEQVTP